MKLLQRFEREKIELLRLNDKFHTKNSTKIMTFYEVNIYLCMNCEQTLPTNAMKTDGRTRYPIQTF